MYDTDKIAILLATYMGENYIEEQLQSLLNQTYTNWIAYIHDDGSTDKTCEIIQSYAEKYADKFVIVYGKSTGGARNNFFFLMSQVRAPYFMFCDQDDIWLPNKIETTYHEMKKIEHKEQEQTPVLVFTELKVVDKHLNTIAEKMSDYQGLDCKDVTLNHILAQNVVTGCTMMINSTLCDKMLQVKNKKHIIMHDWWAALIAVTYGKIVYIDESTILYRQHGENSIGASQATSFMYKLKKFFSSKENKKALYRGRLQAQEFADVFKLSKKHLIYQYAVLGKKNKLKRMQFYWKHKIRKSSLAKQIGIYIWG